MTDERTETSEVQSAVRKRYAEVAEHGPPNRDLPGRVARTAGYSDADLETVPEGANLGLGCGNPVALATLRPGEVVLDLGSGAGFDALLAARAVGEHGRVIGVDMTAEMVEKARANAAKLHLSNVEFRLGAIENLPVADDSIDVIISNCVINLSPDKPRVFAEAYRVLRPGGRLLISDLVSLDELPASVRTSIAAYVGCIAGVSLKEHYLRMLRDVGFAQVEILQEKRAAEMLGISDLASASCACADPLAAGLVGDLLTSAPLPDLLRAAELVVSVQFAAHKPAK